MKELQVARAAGAMDFNGDDDEPPPLELESGSSRSEQGYNQAEEDTSLMDEMVAVAQRAKEETRRRQEKERNSRTFGHGLKKGFFNTKPRVVDAAGGSAKTAVPKTTSGLDKKMPTVRTARKRVCSHVARLSLVLCWCAGGDGSERTC